MKRKRKTKTIRLHLAPALSLAEISQLVTRARHAGVPLPEHLSAQLADYARRRSSSG